MVLHSYRMNENRESIFIRNLFILLGFLFGGYIYEDVLPFNFEGLYLICFFYCLYILKSLVLVFS
jgi:hypothetical protein